VGCGGGGGVFREGYGHKAIVSWSPSREDHDQCIFIHSIFH
jgi:hypothetical protein